MEKEIFDNERLYKNFMKHIEITEENGCWEWTASKNKKGYGKFCHDGKVWRAHRLAWTLRYGPIPDGLFVCHRCDNPGCCNPEHLFLGTNRDNMDDMMSKGRSCRGEKMWSAKLTEKDVEIIKVLLANKKIKRKTIAYLFGVSVYTIYEINAGKKWKHVGGEKNGNL